MAKQWRSEVGIRRVRRGMWEARLTTGQVVPCDSFDEAVDVLAGELVAQQAFRWMAHDEATQVGVLNA